MTHRDTNQLDLMQRFLPAPYRFAIAGAEEMVLIESNDLDIALSVRRFCLNAEVPGIGKVAEWTIMRDHKAPCTAEEQVLLADETLRTLFAGDDTVLIFDRALRKVFGFVGARNTSDLVADLLPILFAV
jgi:hypothetical protein